MKKAAIILSIVLVVGCGYRMVGRETHVPPGLTSIAIPTFVNQTYEPGIEAPLTRAFLGELIQDRRLKVVDRNEADSVLEGVIKDLRIFSVSYDRSGLATEYQAIVVIDLTLKKRTGEILWKEKNLSETGWYKASSNTLIAESNKDASIQEIGRFLADRVRNRIFYNF
jgi:outer membrane lipopolysaccharide assembly protein LptE/RlpB